MCGTVNFGGETLEVHDFGGIKMVHFLYRVPEPVLYDAKIHGPISDWLDEGAPMFEGRAFHTHINIQGSSGEHGYRWKR